MTELVTGRAGIGHIGSGDIRAFNASLFGGAALVMEGCECTIVDANTIRIEKGELLFDGAHIRVPVPEELLVQSGAPGRNRIDLVGIHYTKDSNNIEDAPLVVIPGTPVEGEPSDPAYAQGSILADDVDVFIPMYAIRTEGLSEPVVESRVDGFVDSVCMRMDDLSPAMLHGGTWEQVSTMMFMGLRIWRRVG